MATTIVHLERRDKTVDAIVRAAFPDYSGRKVEAHVQESFVMHGTNWDEGRKRDYVVIRLADMQAVPMPDSPSPWAMSPLHEREHKIAPGFVVVVHEYAGTRDWIEIIAPPDAVSPMLPALVELTQDERTVLVATRSYKSSYAGVSNYRFYEARSQTGITLDRWESAKASCVARGFLTRAGALTTLGRNTIGYKSL